MAKLRGSDRDILYIKEVVAGTTPALPAMKIMRTTGDTMALTRDSFVSAEITSDRGVNDMSLGNKKVNGTLNIELSYENFDDFLDAVLETDEGFGVGLTPTVITNGTTLQSFTLERGFVNGGHYEVYRGMYPNTLTLNIASNAQITGSLEFVGMKYESGVATIANSEIIPRQGGLFNSYKGHIKEGLPTLATLGIASSLTLTITNGLEAIFALFNDSSTDVIDAQCTVTGSLTTYFESPILFNKFAAETESALEFELLDTEGNGYTFLLPRIKFSGADLPVSGPGVVSQVMPFQALQDSTASATIQITKITI